MVMKKYLLFAVAGLLLAGCQKTAQQRTEGVVKEHLAQELSAQDYTPVSFSDFDTLWVSVPAGEASPLSLRYKAISDSLSKAANAGLDKEMNEWKAMPEAERNTDKFRKHVESRRDYYVGIIQEATDYAQKSALEKLKYAAHGKFGGYRITHQYKAKDRAGVVEEKEYTFYVDSTFTKILGSEAGKRKSTLPVVLP